LKIRAKRVSSIRVKLR